MADVLIIDDSLTVRMDLKQAIESAGHTPALCDSLRAARRELAEHRFDLVILDLLLPDGDGLDLLREIKGNPQTAATPVMLLSTETEVGDRIRGMSTGAVDYIGKPYDREYVIARIGQFLGTAEPLSAAGPDESVIGPRRVLAVDDSPTYLHLLAEQLREDGIEVALARSGEQALQLLAAQPVDAILLDVIMPGLSGEETCRKIKSSPASRTIPVLMLTGLDDREAMIASFNAGADDFISKSSDFAVLRARLRAQLRRKQFEDENRRIREQLHHKEVEAAEARAYREVAVQLRKAKQEAEVASRAKDHFLAVLSHELRTPLTPVLTALSMLQGRGGFDEETRESLEMIRRNVELEARLIDDLLDVTRIAGARSSWTASPSSFARSSAGPSRWFSLTSRPGSCTSAWKWRMLH